MSVIVHLIEGTPHLFVQYYENSATFYFQQKSPFISTLKQKLPYLSLKSELYSRVNSKICLGIKIKHFQFPSTELEIVCSRGQI